MLTIERPHRKRGQINTVKATHVDVDLVWVGARHIKGMDAAVPAKRVPGDAGVECVGGQIALAAHELELLRWHDQMQKALLGAHRAIATSDAVELRRYAKTHAAAVATALHGFHAAIHGDPMPANGNTWSRVRGAKGKSGSARGSTHTT